MRARLVWAVVLVALAAMTGCVSVPTSGPVQRVDPASQRPDSGNVTVVDPPAPGDSPSEIVSGFLAAFARDGADEHQARQFLTTEKAESWNPNGSVLVLDSSTSAVQPEGSVYSYTVLGQLDPGGVYASNNGTGSWSPGLVREDGEWRISTPPDSVLMRAGLFHDLYHQYSIYLFDPSFTVLVPYQVYLRFGASDVLTPTALLSKLSEFQTADPVRNLVVFDSPLQVTLDGKVAEVSLVGQPGPVEDEQRRRFAAQIAYTLDPLPTVDAIQINGGGYQVRGPSGQALNPSIARSDFPTYAPEQSSDAMSLYGLTDSSHVVRLLDDDGNEQDATPLQGAPDVSAKALSSFAISPSGDQIAEVNLAGDQMTVSGVSPRSQPVATIQGYGGLLPPQITRFGDTWTIGQGDNGATLIRVADGKAQAVDSDALGVGRVVAFRISPDGTRLAVVNLSQNTYSLAITTIDRSRMPVAVGNLQRVSLAATRLASTSVIADVAWSDPTDLLLLASQGGAVSDNSTYRLAIDGSTGQLFGQPPSWAVNRIVSVATTDSGAAPAVAFGTDRKGWRLVNNSTWEPFRDDIRFAAYPG